MLLLWLRSCQCLRRSVPAQIIIKHGDELFADFSPKQLFHIFFWGIILDEL